MAGSGGAGRSMSAPPEPLDPEEPFGVITFAQPARGAPRPEHMIVCGHRVVLAASRQGPAKLLGRHPRLGARTTDAWRGTTPDGGAVTSADRVRSSALFFRVAHAREGGPWRAVLPHGRSRRPRLPRCICSCRILSY